MNKFLFKSLLLIACLFVSITASAYDFEDNKIYYTITSPEGKTVGVSNDDNDPYSGSVVIPASVKNGGKTYSVTSIDAYVFSGDRVTSVTIPNSVTTIDVLTFENCTGLKKIIVASENPSYSALDGVLFNKDKSKLVAYPIAKGSTYTIPNSVNEIAAAAFWGCEGLTDVTIPNSVTRINMRAFCGCGLIGVTIPNSVTFIDDSAFGGCEKLTSVTIGNSVTSIWKNTFSDCTSLTSVTIGNSVTEIGYNAFMNCTSLTKIYNNVKDPQSIGIGADAFAEVDKTKCTLYVPTGCKASYKAADVWNEFGNIQEFDPTQPERQP